jgi:Ca2+-binding EF-hand superfamily protein
MLAVPLGPPRLGDIDGDGVVNVNDLLLVINAWGPCPPPNLCPADVTGDGMINVNDLLVVINNWG